MANFFLDNFTDTNGTGLGSHSPDLGGTWAQHPIIGPGTAGAIHNNRAHGGNTTSCWYNDVSIPSADYKVRCETFYISSTAVVVGVMGRASLAADTAYFLFRNNSGVTLQKNVAGTPTVLGSAAYDVTEDAVLELWMEGTTISAYVIENSSGEYVKSDLTTTPTPTAMFSVTDGSITAAGVLGVYLGNSLSSARTQIDWVSGDTFTNEYFESVTSTLNFDDALNERAEEVETGLLMGSNITWFNIVQDRQVPESVLNLTQTVEVEGLIQSRISNLNLSSVAVGELFGQPVVSQNLNLSQQATVVFGVPHSAPWGVANVVQNLGLSQVFSNTPSPNASNTLAFTQEAIASYGLESVLSFTQSAIGGVSREIEQELSLTHSVARGGSIWNRSASSVMALTSNTNGWNGNDKCFRRFGVQSVPEGPGTLTLFSKDGAYSVVLRNPETDNTRRVAFDRVLRETRGGNLIVFRDTSWNVVQTLLFTIVAMKRETLDSLQTFFLNTLGEEILLVDWLGEEWSGVVTKPDELFTEDRDGWWTFAFEFEGTKQLGKSVYHNLGLTQVASAIVESP